MSGICRPILANIWNEEILPNKYFPEDLKLTDVSPVFKKKGNLLKITDQEVFYLQFLRYLKE